MLHSVLDVATFHCMPCDNGVYTTALVRVLRELNMKAHMREIFQSFSHYSFCEMKQIPYWYTLGLDFVHLGTCLLSARILVMSFLQAGQTTLSPEMFRVSAYLQASSFFHCDGCVHF